MMREDDPSRGRHPLTPANMMQSETSLLTPALKAAWLEVVTPPRDARARVWSELATTSGGGTLSETVARVDRAMGIRALGAPLAQVHHWFLAKWIVTGVLLTGVLAAVLIARPRTTPGPNTALASTPGPAAALPVVAATLPSRSATAPDPLPLPMPHKPEAPRRAKPRPRGAPVVASPEPDTTPLEPLDAPRVAPAAPQHDLASDLKLLRRAAAALAANEPAAALRLLDSHDALYANSALSKEKAALRIMARCALGRPQARAERDAFLLAERHSPLGERVRDACTGLR
jgi:hypothetical protein